MESLVVMLIHVFNGYNLKVEKLQLRGNSKWRMLVTFAMAHKIIREPDKHVYLHVACFP